MALIEDVPRIFSGVSSNMYTLFDSFRCLQASGGETPSLPSRKIASIAIRRAPRSYTRVEYGVHAASRLVCVCFSRVVNIRDKNIRKKIFILLCQLRLVNICCNQKRLL